MTVKTMAILILPTTKVDGRLLTIGMMPGGVGGLRKKGWMDGNEREGLAGDGASVGGKWATE